MKPLIYLEVADQEMVEAAQYYDAQREGLGRVFLEAVVRTAQQLQLKPTRWAFRSKPVCRALVERFPYQMLFVEEPERIVVVAIMHVKRHPDYWKDRLA